MKKTSKKLLSIILAILMVATTIPTFAITAFAEEPPKCNCTNKKHSIHYYVTEVNETTVKEYVYTKSKFSFESNETMSWWNNQAHITPKENTWYYFDATSYGECTDAAKKKYTMEDIAKGMGDDLYFYWDDETMDFVAVFMTYVDDTCYCHSYINTDELNENSSSVISAISVEEADVEGYEAKINLNADFNIDINEQGEVEKIKTGDYILNKAEPGKTIDEIKSLIGNDIFYYVYNETQFGEIYNGIYVKNNGIYQNDDTYFEDILLTKKLNDTTYAVCDEDRGFMFFILKDGKLDAISLDWENKPVYKKEAGIELAKCTLKHKGDCQNEANGVHYVVNYNKLYLDKGMIIANVFDNGKLRYTTMLYSNPTFTKTLKDGNILTIKKGTENEYVLCPKAYLEKNNLAPAPTWNTTKVSTQLTAGIRLIEHKDAKDAKISWGKVADADGYIIYANYCGSKEKAIKTVTNNKTTCYSFKKLNGKALDLTKPIKVYVAAYKNVDGKKVQMGKSLVVHHSGVNNKKYTVVKTVKLNKNAVTITQGKTFAVKATVNKASAKKALQTEGHSKYYRYISSNPSVATVNANGVITAKKAGKCTIYVVTQNGSKAKLAVTVKESTTTPEIFKDGAQVQLGFYNVYSKVNIETSFVFKDNKYEITKHVFNGVEIPLDQVNSSGIKAEKKGDVFSFYFGQYPDANSNLQDCYLIIDTKAKTYTFDMDKNDVYVTHILVNGKDIAKDMKSITGKNLKLPFKQE